jgi:site-specific DNA-methyltransferase (adenine-specific)
MSALVLDFGYAASFEEVATPPDLGRYGAMPIPRFAGEQLSFDPPGYLFFGDNLEVLRRHIPDDSVDLIYLDPPFNSNRSYNLLFEYQDGTKTAGQQKAFGDSWSWTLQSARLYEEIVSDGGGPSAMLRGMREMIGTTDMLAYITMMTPRLIEMQRVLKDSGSLYLHCDPTASHYLKIMLDAIFGPANFRNEIIWKRYGAHSNVTNGYGAVHDVLFFYSKDRNVTFNKAYQPYDDEYVKQRFRFTDPDGRRWSEQNLANPADRPNLKYDFVASNGVTYASPPNGWKFTLERMTQLDQDGRLHYPKKLGGRLRLKNYLDEMPGVALQDVWTDISLIGGTSGERLGYPTQKPLGLLERIIATSSNTGDVVLDPFCGCGTAIDAAQKLGRRWIGIDITKVAIEVICDRMTKQFPNVQYVMGGEPATAEEAVVLADLDKYEFQRWALERIGISKPIKKGADRGIDGEIVGTYETGRTWRAIVSVKGGGVNVQQLRDLLGTMSRERAEIGIFVTLKGPTAPMKREAAEAGFTKEGYPRLQILTIADLFDGRKLELPSRRSKRTRVRRLRLPAAADLKPAASRTA